MITQLSKTLLSTTRASIRDEVTGWFLKEQPGTGNGQLRSDFHYAVENLSGSRQVVLRRPAFLNKGFDFGVAVPGVNFGNRHRELPRHQTILADLRAKKAFDTARFVAVQTLIDRIYNCENVPDSDIPNMDYESVGYPLDHILKISKWLFIEQDITYWNFSGRAMFYSSLSQM